MPTIEQYVATFKSVPERVEAAFFGGSFTGIPLELQQKLLEQAKTALDRGLIDAIRLSTRPDYINSDILEMLRCYRVETIEIGVQSMDDHVLEKSCRGHTSEDVRRAAGMIHDRGFRLGLQMMIGLPGDRREKDVKTAVEIARLKPDFVRIYPTLVIKDTRLENMYKKGEYVPLDIEEAVDICRDLMEIFLREDIAVIRIGLQPTDRITSGGDIVAGPFHPAFRQLVESALLRKIILKVLKQEKDLCSGEMRLEVHPSMVSTVIGIGRESIDKLNSLYPHMRFKVTANTDLDKTSIRFSHGGNSMDINYRALLRDKKDS